VFQKKVADKIKTTHFIFNKFISNNHAVYGIMWKEMVQLDRSQMTV